MKPEQWLMTLIIWGLLAGGDVVNSQGREKPSWKHMATDKNHGWENYYDSKRVIQTSDGVVRVWVKQVPIYKDEEEKKAKMERLIENREGLGIKTDGYRDYAYSVTLIEIKCEANEGRSVSIVDYDKADKELGEDALNNPTWAPISPRSWLIALIPEVCNQKK